MPNGDPRGIPVNIDPRGIAVNIDPRIPLGPFFSETKIKVDGAFEGGGAKGFAYLGALDAIARAGIWFDRVSGCSAGAITAALISSGYRVESNYNINLRSPPHELPPNYSNSLNKIIMEDNYIKMYDLPQTILNDEIKRSWTKKIMDKLFPVNNIIGPLMNLKENVRELRIGFKNNDEKNKSRNKIIKWLKKRENVPPLGLHEDIAKIIANFIVNTTDVIISPVGNATRDAILTLLNFIPHDISHTFLSDLYRTKEEDPDPIKAAKLVFREGFSILERGGIFTGDAFRDWLENHLQARRNSNIPEEERVSGASANGYVAFKDLPMDLCIVAFCIDCHEIIYFSKKTTPDYSVSEAVRRSVSLPLAFIPRRLNEGHPGTIPMNDPSNLKRHENHIIADGGFRIDLPSWVFRDTQGKYMDYNIDKILLCMKLNELKAMPSKSLAGIPIAEEIDFPHLNPYFLEKFIPDNHGLDTLDLIPPGINILLKEIPITIEAITSREEEIKSLIQTWKNTWIIDIGVKMAAIDPRPMTFNISKKGKMWMAKSGWDAGIDFLESLNGEIDGQSLNIPNNLDPYKR